MTTALVELRAIAQKLEKQPYHPNMELAMTLVKSAAEALAQANGAKEVKDIRDKLYTFEHYFKLRGAQLIDSNLLVAQRIRTEYKIGKIANQTDKEPGRRTDITSSPRETRLQDLQKQVGVGRNLLREWQILATQDEADLESLIEQYLKDEELSTALFVGWAKSELRRRQRDELIAQAEQMAGNSETYQLIEDDFRNVKIAPASIDAIITDPPYAREYIPLYADLAKFASAALKDGGSLIVMTGQSYLPEILSLMTPHIQYYWICAYLASGEAPHLWQKQVNTTWKPLLWFAKGGYRGQTISDVFKSDANDKRFHEWGQSESGMADIVERLTLPGQIVLDPFCGAEVM